MQSYTVWNPLSSGGTRMFPRKTKRFWIKFWGTVTSLLLIAIIGGFILAFFAFVIFARDLPSPYKLTQRQISLSTKIYDRQSQLLYDIYGSQNRALVNSGELPPYVREATIAIEDKDFYKHKGFSERGFLRALFTIVFKGKLQGGSTLTQQVVKNALLTPERTITRKIKEFILAIQIEQRYSKDEILQIYLNEVAYGGTAYGVEAAAETYFSKNAKDLTLTEAVILAGLPQKPSYYSPFGSNPKAYVQRSTDVARRMREDGYITREEEEKIKKQLPNIQFAPQGAGIKAPHFVLYVKDLLVEQFGQRIVEQGGLQVKTTLDLKLQEEVQKIVAGEIGKLTKLKVGNGAALVLAPKTGEILAMVGSKDYFAKDYDGNVNVALSLRQPGSAIKPVNYATAFKKGYTPSFLIMDVATEFPGGVGQPPYKPVNYDGKFHGPMQVRYALGNSINLAAVKMLALNGIQDMLVTANDMGLSTLAPTDQNISRFGLSLTLGGGEIRLLDMAQAFSVFANGGVRVEPVAILEVKDSKGATIFKYNPPSGKKVLSEEISYLISSILSDNDARAMAFGANSLLRIPGKTVAVKTGTTDDKRDNWTLGYTKSVVVGVWVGNNDNSPMHPSLTSGVTGAAPIWNRIMRYVAKDKPDEQFKRPDNLIEMEIDAIGGGLPCPGFPTRREFFIKGTEPKSSCLVQKEKDGKTYFVFQERDPVSTDGRNRWQEGINLWMAAQGDERYHPPPELLAGSGQIPHQVGENDVIVNILSPASQAKLGTVVDIEAQVFSGRSISTVELWVDGVFVKSKGSSEASSENRYNFTYDFGEGASGKHKIEIKAQNENGTKGQSDVEIEITS
jgi:penicillin-binding protein 1C